MPRVLALVVCLVVTVTACGGSSGTVNGSGNDGTTTSTTGDLESGSSGSSETVTSSTAAEPDAPASTGTGTATITLGGETAEFTGLTCYFDAEATELAGYEESFLAIAEKGEARLIIEIGKQSIMEFLDVLYQPDDSNLWKARESPQFHSYTYENGHLMLPETEFELVILHGDGDFEPTETTETGSVEATCS